MPRAARAAAALLLAGVLVALFLPALGFELFGDDYEIAQLARDVGREPARLFAPIGQFFRPLTTWSFLADRALWGTSPAGWHATTLALHVAAALLLVALALRLGVPEAGAWLAGLAWATSPFVAEVAVAAAVRHEQTLLIGWLVMLLAWPREGRAWSRGRLAAAGLGAAVGLLSKETWVVTPALVLAAEIGVRRARLREAALPVCLATLAAAAYVAVRFALLPGFGGYYELRATLLAKVPHLAAAFLYLEAPHPAPERVSAVAAAGLAAVAGLAVLGLRRRQPAVAVGAALLVAPLAPILAVPYLPLRYGHIPLAGFALLAAGSAAALLGEVPARARRAAGAAAALLALLYAAAGARLVRATLADYARVSAAHAALLVQARTVAPQVPLDRPVVVVRLEENNPLYEVARAPHGVAQLYYTRHADPDGLIDAAALLEWALDRPGVAFRPVEDWQRLAGSPGALLGHRPDSFAPPSEVPDVADAARRCVERRLRFRVVQARGAR